MRLIPQGHSPIPLASPIAPNFSYSICFHILLARDSTSDIHLVTSALMCTHDSSGCRDTTFYMRLDMTVLDYLLSSMPSARAFIHASTPTPILQTCVANCAVLVLAMTNDAASAQQTKSFTNGHNGFSCRSITLGSILPLVGHATSMNSLLSSHLVSAVLLLVTHGTQ